jgi:hypothetical protein
LKNTTLTNIILWIVLFGSVFFVGITSSQVTYDPLLDVNGDGYGGIDDIVAVAEHFGASGTPINWTQVLEDIVALEDRVTSLEDQMSSGAMHVESGEFDGVVNSDMVEKGGVTTINFISAFTTTAKPQMVIIVFLKAAADGLTEGSAIKVVEDVKGAANNWTGFDLTVSKYSGGSISDLTSVYVTWLAIGPS